ncbi:TIGR01841 family phasin [Solimicrobium silvestre]|uniref:Phasin: phasin family protein n=1 Tax=Solimicrobium silvestre TaxID=2099400 RepID=A0A2S9GZ07_9BURK|nr:TIGR01841 family phasin [Solimicrobium silvestre]PRC92943.1 phasin: phasin family protein [Solimicrobium silvestre]
MSASTQEKMIGTIQEQQAQWLAFVAKALESSMKLVELNARMTKQSLDDSSQSLRYLLEVKAPGQIFALDAERIQDKLNRMLSYANEFSAITSAFGTEFSQIAQAQISGSCNNANKLFEGAQQVTPDTLQKPFDVMFSALGNPQNGYEQWMGAGKKFAEVIGQNLMMTPSESAPAKRKSAKSTSNGS